LLILGEKDLLSLVGKKALAVSALFVGIYLVSSIYLDFLNTGQLFADIRPVCATFFLLFALTFLTNLWRNRPLLIVLMLAFFALGIWNVYHDYFVSWIGIIPNLIHTFQIGIGLFLLYEITCG